MYTAMAFALILSSPAAPVPKEVVYASPTGAAPRVMELKPNQDGKVMMTIRRRETVKAPAPVAGAVQRPDRILNRIVTVELGDVKDLAITTANGKALDLKDALERMRIGAIVVITTDGKPVDPAYLRVFREETIVLSSPELIGIVTSTPSLTTPARPGNLVPGLIRPGIQVVPAPQVEK